MNREIKFRAWDNMIEKMRIVDSVTFLANNEHLVFIYSDENGKPCKDPDTLFTDHEKYGKEVVLMQYTGLKDKNGKEIYEGDIVRVYNQTIREVVFKHAYWQMMEYLDGEVLGGFGTPTDSGHKPIYRYPEDCIEVIGNIYENRNLLNTDKESI